MKVDWVEIRYRRFPWESGFDAVLGCVYIAEGDPLAQVVVAKGIREGTDRLSRRIDQFLLDIAEVCRRTGAKDGGRPLLSEVLDSVPDQGGVLIFSPILSADEETFRETKRGLASRETLFHVEGEGAEYSLINADLATA